jgi:capsular exopolysaccharide synthesis family protein
VAIRGICVISGMESGSYIHSYVGVVRRRLWWLIAGALLGLAISLAYSFTAPNEYSATAQLLVEPSAVIGVFGPASQPVSQTDVLTELQLVTGTQVEQRVAAVLGSASAISASEVGQTNVIALTATSRSAVAAARVANAYADQFVAYQESVGSRNLAATEAQLQSQIRTMAGQIKALRGTKQYSAQAAALVNQEAVLREQLAQTRVSGAVNTAGVEVVARAQVPAAPSSPKPVQDAVLGFIAGLAVGLAGAFVRDNLDDTVSSTQSAELASGATVLGSIPLIATWRDRGSAVMITAVDPTAPASESYRTLRTSIQFIAQERPLRSLLISSPAAGDGKTSTVANLGVTFSQVGDRVVVVSCDLRRPRLSSFFGAEEQVGLTSVLLGKISLEQALVPVRDFKNLWLLPSGPVPPNPAELLSLEPASELFAALRAEFDRVLIDSPPVLPVTDAVVLTRHSDATLIAVAAGRTRLSDLRRAADRLDQAGAYVAGVVVNQTTKLSGYGHYGYGYGYGRYESSPESHGQRNVHLTDLDRLNGAHHASSVNQAPGQTRSFFRAGRPDS